MKGAPPHPLDGAWWLLRLGLGGLFVYAGLLKLGDPTRFALEIHNYQLLPSLAPYLAVCLPPMEIVLGVAVIVAPRRWRRAAGFALAGVLAVFTFAVVSAVARHVNIECGCFGGRSGPVDWLTVVRDLALLAVAIALTWLDLRPAPPAAA